MRAPRLALVTVFGLGLLRPAPGTWGSLPPVAAVIALLALGAPRAAVDGALAVLIAAFGVACIALGSWAERHFARTDPRQVVADETVGQALALLALPWSAELAPNLLLVAVAFAAFRLFDVAKPPPIRAVQSVRGGWGILLDDLLAGLAALVVAQVTARLWLPA